MTVYYQQIGYHMHAMVYKMFFLKYYIKCMISVDYLLDIKVSQYDPGLTSGQPGLDRRVADSHQQAGHTLW